MVLRPERAAIHAGTEGAGRVAGVASAGTGPGQLEERDSIGIQSLIGHYHYYQ